ncbi:hypothetical protein HK099_000331, partial [Clydaea vesicula]
IKKEKAKINEADVPQDDHHVEVTEALDAELEKLLLTPPNTGLTTAQVEERLLQFGKNEIPENKTNPWLKFLSYFLGAISFLLEFAAVITAILQSWADFIILVSVLIINACIGFFEEARAESALDALKNTLALKSRTWRNGELIEVDSALLVPGDIIAIRLGDIIPADCRLLGIGVTGEETEGALQIDQAALTGESLPVSKKKGDTAYSSSICKQGQMLAVVVKTGVNTYIGRAANLISITNEQGHFQIIINRIGNFLVLITVVMALVILFVSIFAQKMTFLHALEQVVVLTIAAIPVGLPTVMSVTMAVGASQLAKKKVIVKRLTAIEELASVSILCSDKTGTLTENKLSFDEPYLANKGSTPSDIIGTGERYTAEDILLDAYFSSEPGAQDPIESAIRKAAESGVALLRDRPAGSAHNIPGYKVDSFTPFNPNSKYTEAKVTDLSTGKKFRVIKGAPQVIVRLCGGHSEATAAVVELAKRGLRALGVARTVDENMEEFELVGMVSLLDPPRPDSGETIRRCMALGVAVKMITGDQAIIAKEVAYRLGMQRTILDATSLTDPSLDVEQLTERCVKADGFAQVIPEHKYRVVELLQDKGLLVAMTGDGVNDAPALKKADVGIAVEGCTDAARSAADIVLLDSGLSTIVDGIETSRAIFQRMRSYALYRIASTIHFLLFFFFSILIFQFTLPNKLILLIAVLNDAATLVISIDNARINKRPDKWRLGQLISLSFVLGVLLCIISYAHFFVAKDIFNLPVNSKHDTRLHTIMYLQISSCPHFVIFSTRLSDPFYKNMPSIPFIVAIAGTQVFAMFMSIYGFPAFDAQAIGWGWGLAVMGISTVSFMLLDVVKVLVIKNWSFEVTAKLWPVKSRRSELSRRKGQALIDSRVRSNIKKVRAASKTILAVSAFQDKTEKKLEPSTSTDNVDTVIQL